MMTAMMTMMMMMMLFRWPRRSRLKKVMRTEDLLKKMMQRVVLAMAVRARLLGMMTMMMAKAIAAASRRTAP